MARIDDIVKRANQIYAERKGMPDNGFRAPEAVPQIRSDQVLAAIEAVMEEVDRKLAKLVSVPDFGGYFPQPPPINPAFPPFPPGSK